MNPVIIAIFDVYIYSTLEEFPRKYFPKANSNTVSTLTLSVGYT